jgi:hypothetical protein
MAEIEIQRKKRPVWPWILAAIAIIVVLWLVINSLNRKYDKNEHGNTLMEGSNDSDAALAKRIADAKKYEKYPGPIGAFIHFAHNDETVDVSQHHHYTNQGLHQLVDALHMVNAKKDGGEAVAKKLNLVVMESDKLLQNPGSELHSGIMRNAFIMSTEAMASLQQKFYPGLENKVANVRQAAESLDSNKPAMEQQSKIKSFFEKSADVLEEMGAELKD